MKIKDLKLGPNYLAGFVSELRECQTARGDSYISFRLSDKEDKIDVKIWQTQIGEIEKLNIKNGSFVVAKGICQLYKEKKQFTVEKDNKIKLREVNEEDNIDINDYMAIAPIDFEEIRDYLIDAINMIVDSEIREFTMKIFDDYHDELIRFPASINVHHDYKNGLGYHLYRMVKSAIKLKDVYERVNFDYIIAGVIIHDIGKIKCYKITDSGAPEDYTLENSLIGHIPMGLIMIESYELSEEKKNLMRHLLLSHHGREEFGAIVPPMFIEAEILHMLDMMDSKITIMENVLDGLEPGEVSDRIWTLDRAKIYKLK
ncbi:MAG: hypothetical protein Q4P34_07990 [Tissierellia bacterium]|nr:hypothetical protein [Tissierellia bacterium]